MGLGPFSRDSYPKDNTLKVEVTNVRHVRKTNPPYHHRKHRRKNINPNPNPANYQIICHKQIGRFLIVEIEYPDCTNYEGKKVLLYENVSFNDLLSQKLIDPHFSENKNYHSPVARFEPTIKGWNMAESLCELLKERK